MIGNRGEKPLRIRSNKQLQRAIYHWFKTARCPENDLPARRPAISLLLTTSWGKGRLKPFKTLNANSSHNASVYVDFFMPVPTMSGLTHFLPPSIISRKGACLWLNRQTACSHPPCRPSLSVNLQSNTDLHCASKPGGHFQVRGDAGQSCRLRTLGTKLVVPVELLRANIEIEKI